MFLGDNSGPLIDRWCRKLDLNRYDGLLAQTSPQYLESLKGHVLHAMGIPFKEIGYYAMAFCHKSFCRPASRRPEAIFNYERLEWLGDAVLEMYARLYIYRKCPDLDASIMRDVRNVLVSNAKLADVSLKCGFLPLILRAPDFMITESSKMIADIFESFVAALFCDLGPRFVEVFLEATLFQDLEEIIQTKAWIKPRARLLAFLQNLDHRFQANYVTTQTTALPPQFQVQVFVFSNLITTVVHESKTTAIDMAALETLSKLNRPMAVLNFPFLRKAQNSISKLRSNTADPALHIRSRKGKKSIRDTAF